MATGSRGGKDGVKDKGGAPLMSGRRYMILATLLLVGLATLYFVLRPSRIDTCSSEILTNGRGVSVDLGAKTVSLGGETKQVSIQEISNKSALIIDSLSRLCREKLEGTIDSEEYRKRFDAIVSLLSRSNNSANGLPKFDGIIDVVGYDGNQTFIDFLEANNNNVIQLKAAVERSLSTTFPGWNQNCMYDDKGDDVKYDSNSNYISQNDKNQVFNRWLPLPQVSMELDWSFPDGSSTYCEKYGIVIKTDDEEIMTSAGTGDLNYLVNGFFRVSGSALGSQRTFFLTEVQATAGDFAN